MMRLLDRAILRELLFPFAMAVTGFVLFILLNLILQLSDFAIDRDVAWSDLVRVLAYKLPDLVVIGLPIAVLFAVFLALGRMKHDHELIALQASGISLRRVLVPVVAFGVLVGALTLVLNEEVAPWANRQYQTLLRQLLLRGSVPKIRDNTFFKDEQNRFFYVKRYDPQRKLLQDVLVFDPSGRTYLPALKSPYPQLITAKQARWDGTAWILTDGVAHQLDENGALVYQVSFQTLTIQVGDTLRAVFLEQRTPREMSLGELAERIKTLQASGYRASELIVEFQAKLVVPLGALVFALFAAPLSLSFGFRGRAAGIVVSVLLTGTYQGALFWAETLARRELLSPVWGPWLPNLAFGGLGLVLAWNVDRFSRLEWGRWLRRSLVIALVLLGGGRVWAAPAQEPLPLEVSADALELSQDGRYLRAQGAVSAAYGRQTLRARQLKLWRLEGERWRLQAEGQVVIAGTDLHVEAERVLVELESSAGGLGPRWMSLTRFAARSVGEQGPTYRAERGTLRFSPPPTAVPAAPQLAELLLEGGVHVSLGGADLSAESLVLQPRGGGGWRASARGNVQLTQSSSQVQADQLGLDFGQVEGEISLQRAAARGFRGRSPFENARGQTHTLRFAGRGGQLDFADGQLQRLELEGAALTTCTCAARVERASYALRAQQLVLWPDEWVLGRGITFSASGWPLFWTPLFLAPLKDLQQNPLWPQLGRDARRGWFARWRLPVFVDRDNTGALLLDLFSRYRETGLGLDWNYALSSWTGRLHLYHLVGTSEVLELNWSQRGTIGKLATLQGALERRQVRPAAAGPTSWAYALRLNGGAAGWQWDLAATRQEVLQAGEEAPRYRVLERLPELKLAYALRPGHLPLSARGSFNWGRYREQRAPDGPFTQADRLEALGQLAVAGLRLRALELQLGSSAEARWARYGQGEQQVSTQAQLELNWHPWEPLSANVSYLYRAVRGHSPFAFDSPEVADRWTGRLQLAGAGLDLELSNRYLPRTGRLGPWVLRLNGRRGPLALSATLTTLADSLRWQSWTVQGRWSFPSGQGSWLAGYDLPQRRFEDLIAKLSLGPNLGLGVRLDPNRLRLRRTNAELRWSWGRWSLDFRGEFDWAGGRFSALQVGLVRHLCHDCWQVGLYLSDRRVWFQVQINAFPTAGLSYSPTDGALSFP